MKQLLFSTAAAVAVLLAAGAANAQTTLAYSYEVNDLFGRPDGWFGLGAGAAVSQDTIGATHLTKSMKYVVGTDGFGGARTESVIPPALNNPPGVNHVLFDMTIVDAYAGGFADIGITIFGHTSVPLTFGNSVQFADTEPIAGKAPGTYTDLRINLDLSLGSFRPGESFNAIVGTDPGDITTVSAFQFFVSKNAGVPATVYIDNVRLVVPEPASVGLTGFAGLALLALRRRMAGLA